MMCRKTILAFVISFALLGAGGVLAQSAASADTASATAASTTATSTDAASVPPSAVDTLPSAGLTPRSPFYFLDRFGDWARLNLFTFNPVKKAEVRAEIANERLAELKEVSDEDPQRTDIIEELEDAVAKRMDEVHGNLEKFNSENKKVAPLLEKMENLSLNSQKVMENMLLKNVPERIKARTEKSLEKIYKFAKKRREILLNQKEKGLLSGAEMERLTKIRMRRLKNQIERRAARVSKITNPALRKRLKKIMSKKLDILEDDIFSTESAGGTSGGGGKIGNLRREAIRSILQARKRIMLRGATTTNEILNNIYNGKINFRDSSGELIKEAEEKISDIREKLGETGSATPKISRSAKVLLAIAEKHLTAAKKAFEAKKYREAFGSAISAVRNSQRAIRMLDRFEGEGYEKGVDYMEREERKEMKEHFIFKRKPKGREEESGENGKSENKRGIVCSHIVNPVCGTDGITYPNRCFAEKRHGVDVRHKGRCLKNFKRKFNSVKNSSDAGDNSTPHIED